VKSKAIMAASDQTLRRIRHLLLEYHFPTNLCNEDQFFDRLRQAGFDCTWKSRRGRLAQFARK
jgi:hypothetical protein